MNIKELTEQSGFSAHILRYYEKIGLLFDVRCNSSEHRAYSPANIEWINFLTKLKSTGDMKEYARFLKQGEKTISQRKNILEKHKEKVEADIVELQFHLEKIKTKLNHYKKT